MERFVYCNEVKQIVVQRASLKKIKTSQVFSYIVFATSVSSIAARAHLWCWLATVARRLLLYGCAQRLRETKLNGALEAPSAM